MIQVENLVGGKFVIPDETFDDISPIDNSIIACIPRTKDANSAVEAAKKALPSWRNLTISERCDWLEKIADVLESNIEEIARLESLDTGKPYDVALNVDASRSVKNFRFFADFGRNLAEENYKMSDAVNYVIRKPIGIVGLISPWNLPLYLLTWKVAPALLMGNTIIAKPSEITPLTAHYFGQLCTEIGLPDGVLNILNGYGPEIGQSIVEHPEIKAISFTGGTETGKVVAATAAPMFKKLSLELGGKSPVAVFDDAEQENAINGITAGIFGASGQSCIAGSRLYLQKGIYDEFLNKLSNRASKIKIGAPMDPETEMGPLSNFKQLEVIEKNIKETIDQGGKIKCGGERHSFSNKGYYFPPTIIECDNHNLPVAENELFGPVLSVMKFDTEEEVISKMNDNQYGLSSGVYTSNLSRGMRVSKAIRAGITFVNTYRLISPSAPFGGIKDSGYGKEAGIDSIKDYTRVKTTWFYTSDEPTLDPFSIR